MMPATHLDPGFGDIVVVSYIPFTCTRKHTWSKLRAHVVHVYIEFVCFGFASCMLSRVNGMLVNPCCTVQTLVTAPARLRVCALRRTVQRSTTRFASRLRTLPVSQITTSWDTPVTWSSKHWTTSAATTSSRAPAKTMSVGTRQQRGILNVVNSGSWCTYSRNIFAKIFLHCACLLHGIN